tara:strand:- start:105 stop:554 length:450 start_codon:yes stop_codon:yes gene_type:complete
LVKLKQKGNNMVSTQTLKEVEKERDRIKLSQSDIQKLGELAIAADIIECFDVSEDEEEMSPEVSSLIYDLRDNLEDLVESPYFGSRDLNGFGAALLEKIGEIMVAANYQDKEEWSANVQKEAYKYMASHYHFMYENTWKEKLELKSQLK